MATCNSNTLLLSGVAFSGLSPQQRQTAVLRLLSQWLLALDPSADVTPDAIMARASGFGGLNPMQQRIAFLQLLCDIRGT